MSSTKVIFFDIGDTLAAARVNNAGRLVSLEPLPGVLDALRRLRDAGYRLGIISNTGEETTATLRLALTTAGLYGFFEPEPALLIYSSEVQLTKIHPRYSAWHANAPGSNRSTAHSSARIRVNALSPQKQVSRLPPALTRFNFRPAGPAADQVRARYQPERQRRHSASTYRTSCLRSPTR